jgi:D-alanine--poly(phosphoribitol) ligase subunit 2
MDEIRKVILDYVKKEYLEEDDDRVIDETTPLITSGIVDSFSMVSLKVFLEKKYQVRIPDEEATPAAFDTVVRIAELVTKIREAAPKATVP